MGSGISEQLRRVFVDPMGVSGTTALVIVAVVVAVVVVVLILVAAAVGAQNATREGDRNAKDAPDSGGGR